MTFFSLCTNRYKFENNKIRAYIIVFMYCFVLSIEIITSIYIVQIAKRRTSLAFSFNMQIPDQVEYLFVCLYMVAHLLYKFVSEVLVCIKTI